MISHAAARAFVMAGLAFATVGCGDECGADGCAPCVGETCTATCVSPDGEDDAEACPYSCSDGADCSLTCGAVSCHLACDASTCACDPDCESLSCTRGADCRADYAGRITCDASKCESAEHHEAICTNGANCLLACGPVEGDANCRTSCDNSSVCHLECHGRCLLCCNGSPDCTMEGCAFEAMTCSDGTISCGVDCATVGPAGWHCPAVPGG